MVAKMKKNNKAKIMAARVVGFGKMASLPTIQEAHLMTKEQTMLVL